MTWPVYEGLLETLDILGDEELAATLRVSIAEFERTETISWSEARRELGRAMTRNKQAARSRQTPTPANGRETRIEP
ncbi:MAG: hypothetical protein M5U22_07870 [Thermoleophilia bacterium]|nr:hypothetical protein [Thermoleophilia bacterium]